MNLFECFVQFSYAQILMISIMFDWREDHILVRKYYILLSENTIFNIYDVCRNNARYQKNIKQLIKCTGKRCFFCHKKFLNKLRKFTLICKKYLSWKSKVQCTADIIIFFLIRNFHHHLFRNKNTMDTIFAISYTCFFKTMK